MKVMRVFSRVSCDTGWVKCDSSSWRLCWNNDYLCSQDAWQYRWFYDPAVKELCCTFHIIISLISWPGSFCRCPSYITVQSHMFLISILTLTEPELRNGCFGELIPHMEASLHWPWNCVPGSMAGANGPWFRRSAGRRSTKGSWLRRIYQYSFISSRASSSDKERLFLIRSSVFSKLQPRSLQLLMRAWITWFRPSIRPELRPSISPVLCPSL